MKKTFIYTLSDPITEKIRYVGKSNDPKKRLYDHIKLCKLSFTYKNNWIKSLLNINMTPILNVIDEVDIDNWQFWEKYWILKLREEGHDLTNFAEGGNGPTYHVYKDRTTIIEKMKIRHKEFPKYNLGKGNSRIFLDKDSLYQKYIIENLSLNRCASYFDVSKKTVFTNITEYNFKKNKKDWCHQLVTNPCKPVIQYSLNGDKIAEFLSAAEANKVTNTNISSISNCCIGRQKSAGGFIWKYK